MRLKGKSAIVTGGGSGIGGAIARRFASEGAAVVVADLDPERSGRLVEQINEQGGEAAYVKVDVTEAGGAQRMVEEAIGRSGKLDILVNNVGGGRGNGLEELDEAMWDWNFNFVLKGTFLSCKAAMPHLLEGPGAAIVNISSINGVLAIGLEAYSAAKAGVVSFTQNLAIRYGPRGVRANVVAPGTTETDFWIHARESDPEIFDRLGRVYPVGRVGRPDDIANAALFLASDEAAFINGALLPVDGGFTAGTDVFERTALHRSSGQDIWGSP